MVKTCSWLVVVLAFSTLGADAEVFWQEDFNACQPGVPPADWQVSAPEGAGTVTVSTAPLAVPGETADDQCLCLDDRSAEHQLEATRPLPTLEGRFVVEYDTMMSLQTDQACAAVYVDRLVCLAYVANDLVYFDGSDAKRALSYAPGTWYRVRYTVDPETKTYALYVDERLIADAIEFRTPRSELSELRCETGQVHARGAVHVDNIVVRSLTDADERALQAGLERIREEERMREDYAWLDATEIDVPENWHPDAWYRKSATPGIHYDLSAGVRLDDSSPQSDHVIVTGEDPGEVVRFAAAELQKYLFRITGAYIPVAHSPGPGRRVVLRIGNKLDARLRGEPEDTYAIVAGPDLLTLSGAGDRGTLYSVYGFLEEHLGCRWYYADVEDEIIPRAGIDDLDALLGGGVDEVERPVMTYRELMILNTDEGADNPRERLKNKLVRTAHLIDWMAKNRFNTVVTEGSIHGMKILPDNWDLVRTIIPEIKKRGLHLGLGGHFWTPFLCDETPGWPDDDSWGALVHGKRHRLKLFDHLGRSCTTSEAAATTFLREVVSFYRANPEFDVWANWPPDSGDNLWCTCPTCSSFSITYRVLKVADQVAQALKHEAARPESPIHGQEIPIIVLGYAEWANPPAEPMQLPENFAIMPDIYRNFSTPYVSGPTDGWKAYMTDNGGGDLIMFGRWCRSFLTGYHLLPPPTIPETVRNLVADGYCGVENFHGAGGWWAKGLWLYASGRAMWEPDVDLPSLIDEYFAQYYGPAAKPMRRFCEANEEAHAACPGNFAYGMNFDLAWGIKESAACTGVNPDKEQEYPGILGYLEAMSSVDSVASQCFDEARRTAAAAPDSEVLLRRIRKAESSWKYYENQRLQIDRQFKGLRCLEQAHEESSGTDGYLAKLSEARQAFEAAEECRRREGKFIRENTSLFGDFTTDHGTLWDGGVADSWAPRRAEYLQRWLAIVDQLCERAEGKDWGTFPNERLWRLRHPSN